VVIGSYNVGDGFGNRVPVHELDHEFAHYVLDYLSKLIGLEEEELG